MAERKGRGNQVVDGPRQGWAYFEETNQWRRTPEAWGTPSDHFPKESGDWVSVSKPISWRPPAGTLAGESLLDGGFGLSPLGQSGDHMKIGAGKYPQKFGRHGWYESAGGGLSGGNEVRGKVSPPPTQKDKEQNPAAPLSKGGRVVATTKNDDVRKPDPNPEALKQKTSAQVQGVLDEDSGTRNINMNSGYRSGDPTAHGEGRAVDINQVNGQKISDAVDPAVPADQREAMRERLEEIRAAAKASNEVEAYIDPLDGFFRPKDPNGKEEGRKANGKEKYDHRHHIHITIRK